MASLEIDFSQFTFIDIGSGKGRALLLAAEYPFRRVVGSRTAAGIECRGRGKYSQVLEREAGLPGDPDDLRGCDRIDSSRSDRWWFSCFNPLPEAGAKEIGRKHSKRSLRENPRPAYVIYASPVFGANCGKLFCTRPNRRDASILGLQDGSVTIYLRTVEYNRSFVASNRVAPPEDPASHETLVPISTARGRASRRSGDGDDGHSPAQRPRRRPGCGRALQPHAVLAGGISPRSTRGRGSSGSSRGHFG